MFLTIGNLLKLYNLLNNLLYLTKIFFLLILIYDVSYKKHLKINIFLYFLINLHF